MLPGISGLPVYHGPDTARPAAVAQPPDGSIVSSVGAVSNLEPDPQEAVCGGAAAVAVEPVHELLAGREVVLVTRGTGGGGMTVTRTLPHRDRRMVGAWCFVDQYGPQDIAGLPGMRVPPHPHTGLQTVSWLVEGEVLHRDSLGSRQLIRPGQLNLMTAGRGISHSEESPRDRPSVLHGVQLWVALPDGHRMVEPGFEHLPVPATPTDTGVAVRVLVGELDGVGSAATVYSPLLGAEVGIDGGARTRLPLRPDFEYAALTLSGIVHVDGVDLAPGTLLYLGRDRRGGTLRSDRPGRVLLLGGEPFDEQIVMWWNFVGRSHDEIVQARQDWMAGDRFGTVRGYDGDPLPAPPMPTATLKPRGRHR
jgi:redox-sensitive bicupin YhaK (pirin superfamily)